MSQVLSFQDLCDRVARARVTLIAGVTDTGKSTIVRSLSEQLKATVVDSDIGQSDIGPPSVVSLGRWENGGIAMADGYFVGSVTPARHFLQLLAGVSRMMKGASTGLTIVNTPGLVTGDIGRSLLTEKINIVLPDLIIAIEWADELAYLDAFSRTGAEVLHIRPATEVREKSVSERRKLRAGAFREHFGGSDTVRVNLEAIGLERTLLNNGIPRDVACLPQDLRSRVVHLEVSGDEGLVVFQEDVKSPDRIVEATGVDILHTYTCADFHNLLVGTMGKGSQFTGLGIIRSVDFTSGTIDLLTPATDFSIVQLGTMKLDPVTFDMAGQFRPVIYHT